MSYRRPLLLLVVAWLYMGCAAVQYSEIQQYMREQKFGLAQRALLEAGPSDAQGWALLSECRYYATDYSGQSEAALKSLALSDEFRPLIARYVRLAYVEQLQNAVRAFNSANELEAVKLLSQVVVFGNKFDNSLDPLMVRTNQRVVAFAALASIRLKNYPQARGYLEGLGAEWKDNPELLEQLAFIYYQIGEARLCVTTCESVLARQPENLNVLKMRAQAAEGLGEHDLALQAYRDVIAHTPDSRIAQRNLGTLLYQFEDWHEAREHLESALSQGDADSLALLRMIAECAYHERKYGEAVTYYRRILHSHSGDEDAERGIGACLWVMGKRDDAQAAFLRANRILAADSAGRAMLPEGMKDKGTERSGGSGK